MQSRVESRVDHTLLTVYLQQVVLRLDLVDGTEPLVVGVGVPAVLSFSLLLCSVVQPYLPAVRRWVSRCRSQLTVLFPIPRTRQLSRAGLPSTAVTFLLCPNTSWTAVSLVLQLTTPHLRCGLRQGEVGLLVRTVGGRGVVDLVEFQPRGPAAQTGQPACTAQHWRISQFNA